MKKRKSTHHCRWGVKRVDRYVCVNGQDVFEIWPAGKYFDGYHKLQIREHTPGVRGYYELGEFDMTMGKAIAICLQRAIKRKAFGRYK